MVNTREYVPKSKVEYVTVELVRNMKPEDRNTVVVPGTGFKTFDHNGEELKKPYITVDLKGNSIEWTLAPSANADMAEELGWETEQWVGALLKLRVAGSPGFEYVSATVLKRP